MRRFLLFIVWSLAWIRVQGQAVNLQHPFPVFDATNFAQEPDLSQYGLKRIPVVYPAYMWDSKEPSVQTSLPDRNRVNAFAQLAAQSSNIVVVDIEQWPLAGDPGTVAASITKTADGYPMVQNSRTVDEGRILRIPSAPRLLGFHSRRRQPSL
jgi:hypothetical protein